MSKDPLDQKFCDCGRPAGLQPFTVQVYYNWGNPNNGKIHVRGEVDGMLVIRRWSKRKQEWMYDVVHPSYIDRLIESGDAKRVK